METKKLTKLIFIALGAWIIIFILCGMRVYAADTSSNSEIQEGIDGQFKELNEPVSAHVKPDVSSGVALKLKKGDVLFVTDESAGWYTVYYRGDTVYVENSVSVTDIDYSEELEAEMTGQAAVDTAWIDEYQMQVRAIKTSRRWRILIAILIVAFIVVTIISTLTKKKPETAKK